MAAILTEAADGLTAAAAVAASGDAAPPSHSDSGDGSNSSSCTSSPAAVELRLAQLRGALQTVYYEFLIYHSTCRLLSSSPGKGFSLEAALPAAPAAVRLILTTYQTCSRLQQLAGREGSPAAQAGSPAAVLLQGFAAVCQQEGGLVALGEAHLLMQDLALALDDDRSSEGSLQPGRLQRAAESLPGARELLLCPELLPCLAISVLVAVLGVDTGAQIRGAGSGGGAGGSAASRRSNTGTAGGSSAAAGGAGSSRGRQASTTQGSSQQPAAPAAAGSSAGRSRQATSGSTRSSGTPTRRLDNGISLDSLTPLSRGLFDLLGVDQGVLLQAVRGAKASWSEGFSPEHFDCLIDVHNAVLDYQAQKLYTPPLGDSNAQLLLQLETDMLLGLMGHQLTASIPAQRVPNGSGYPRAYGVRARACKLGRTLLLSLGATANLHKVPLPAAYTGPQLALQVMPSPLQPQRPDQQEPQQQPQWYTVAPTAQLLTELLPLLTGHCLIKLQMGREGRAVLEYFRDLQQADGGGEAAGPQGSSAQDDADDILSTLQARVPPGCPPTVRQCLEHITALLSCALVPDPDLTAAEVQAAANAASTEQGEGGQVAYRCVLHAAGAVVQGAGEVVRVCEALLRDTASLCETAAQLPDGAGVTPAAAAEQLTPSAVVTAEEQLSWVADVAEALTAHKVAGDFPHRPSALALAALSAGPGSDLQRQLFSLLCSMVKLGSARVAATAASAEARGRMASAAAHSAAALVVGAADKHQAHNQDGGGDSGTAATPMLPGVFILGRCCMWWAQQLQSDASSAVAAQLQAQQGPLTAAALAQRVLPPLQQWLQASSTQEQLVAAGCTPQALPQQLQQAVAALQAVRESTANGQADTSSLLEAAQQLQAAGSTLCSFAVPCLCNNPSCANLSGLTELGLVSGRSCLCGGCRVARYCGRACQRSAWKQHKPVCAALAAAATAASPEACAAVAPPPANI